MSSKNVSLGVHEPFRINLLIVGEPGLGKRTFINTLLKPYSHVEILSDSGEHSFSSAGSDSRNCSDSSANYCEITKGSIFEMTTDTGLVFLHLFDATNYGTNINNSNCIGLLASEIERRMEAWRMVDYQLLTESARGLSDERIHGIFYFIAPFQFKALDREFFRKISKLTSIIPLASKADTMTSQERGVFLARISSELMAMGSDNVIYDFQEKLNVQTHSETGGRIDLPLSPLIREDIEGIEQLEEHMFLQPVSDVEDDSPEPVVAHPFFENYPSDTTNYDGEFESIYSRRLGLKLTLSPACGTHSNDSFYQVEEVEVDARVRSSSDPLDSPERKKPGARGDESDEDSGCQFQIKKAKTLESHDTSPSEGGREKYPLKVANIFAVIGMSRVYDWGTVAIESDQFDTKRLQKLIFDEGHLRGMKQVAQLKMISHYQNRIVLRDPLLDHLVKSWTCWLLNWACKSLKAFLDVQLDLVEKFRGLRQHILLRYLVWVWESKLCCLLAPLVLGRQTFQTAIFPWLFWVFWIIADSSSRASEDVPIAGSSPSKKPMSKSTAAAATPSRFRRACLCTVYLLWAVLLSKGSSNLFRGEVLVPAVNVSSSGSALRADPATSPAQVPVSVPSIILTEAQSSIKVKIPPAFRQAAGTSNSAASNNEIDSVAEVDGVSFSEILRKKFIEALNARGFGYM